MFYDLLIWLGIVDPDELGTSTDPDGGTGSGSTTSGSTTSGGG